MLAAERGAARNTLLAYQADLDDFASFAAARGQLPAACDAALLQAYMASLQRAGLAARTASRRLSALRQFHRFLLREGVRDDDPTTLLDAPRLPRTLPKYLSEQEVEALLDAAKRMAGQRGALARAALEILYATGLRVSELLALPRRALAGDAAVLLIRGKGGRERIVPLSDSAKQAAADLAAQQDKDVPASVSWPGSASCADATGVLPAAQARGAGGGARSGTRVTACAAAFVRLAPAGARCRPAEPADCCWDMRISRQRRSTRMCWRSGCSGWSRRIIRWPVGQVDRYHSASTSTGRRAIRSTSSDAIRQAAPLAMNAAR